MTGIGHRVRHIACTAGPTWRWLLVGLLAAIPVLLALSQPAPGHAGHAGFQFVAAAANIDADCDGTHESGGESAAGHCHATVSCSGYAQVAAGLLAFDGSAQGHPLPATQHVGIGLIPAPNPQPPKRSSQI
jgi:hypothetical protein